FLHDPATTQIHTLSLHDALPISTSWTADRILLRIGTNVLTVTASDAAGNTATTTLTVTLAFGFTDDPLGPSTPVRAVHFTELRSDRKSTRLNSSHVSISYAVFCL